MSSWTPSDLPDQAGRRFVITGANSGIGLEAARELARRGAHVILACRNPDKAARAEADLARDARDDAVLEVRSLDLADLSSVRAFAEGVAADHDHLDVLVNNAGVMALPYRTTADGFEMQLGTNHLGHFALTGHLLPLLRAAPDTARVVHVSSVAHRVGRMRFDDLMGRRRYQRWLAYGQSKLANLLFHHELQRRLDAAGDDLISVACHPGYASTNLQLVGPRLDGSALAERINALGNRLVAQSAAQGAWPTLFAAADPTATRGDYIGPHRFRGMRGHPTRERPAPHARDRDAMARLWDVSVDLTGVDPELSP